SGDAILGEKTRATVAGLTPGAASLGEIDGTSAAKRAGRRRRLARRNGLEGRLSQATRDRAAQAHDLGLLAGSRIAVAGRVHGVEARFNSFAILGLKQLRRQLNRC